jgi:hypothetical protein
MILAKAAKAARGAETKPTARALKKARRAGGANGPDGRESCARPPDRSSVGTTFYGTLRRSLADRDSLGLSLKGCEPIGPLASKL